MDKLLLSFLPMYKYDLYLREENTDLERWFNLPKFMQEANGETRF